MEFYILNRDFEIINLIDSFKSCEWVKRYNEAGDCVLVVNADKKNIETLRAKNYIVREDDEQIIIIKGFVKAKTGEEGKILTVQGKSIVSILGQRIIWKQTNTKTNETVESFIRRLIDENCINPTDSKRKIPRLKLGVLKGYTEKIEKQITGDNLLTAIIDICKSYEYGFKITMNDEGNLIFDLYKGIDRSYGQNANPYVVFSDENDNIINTEYSFDESNYVNTALIGGEGEGTERKYQSIGNSEGMDRYEIFVDAKDVSSNNGEILLTDYSKLLLERGNERMAENSYIEEYSGEIETTRTYVYKKDFDLGDIVQIEDEDGLRTAPRITEIIESENENGYRIVPTYSAWGVE